MEELTLGPSPGNSPHSVVGMKKSRSNDDKRGRRRTRQVHGTNRTLQGRTTHNQGFTSHVRESQAENASRESFRVPQRRPMITMRGPTLGSMEGEVQLLKE